MAHANVESFGIDSDNGIGNNARGISNSFGTSNGYARNGSSPSQGFIYVGSHGNSINDISRYSSDIACIGIRYGNQNGDSLGKITAELTSFDANGFTLNINYIDGVIHSPSVPGSILNVRRDDVDDESIVVLYTAYK